MIDEELATCLTERALEDALEAASKLDASRGFEAPVPDKTDSSGEVTGVPNGSGAVLLDDAARQISSEAAPLKAAPLAIASVADKANGNDKLDVHCRRSNMPCSRPVSASAPPLLRL